MRDNVPLEVWTATEDDAFGGSDGETETPAECADCGDEIEEGQDVTGEPAPEVGPRTYYTVHAHCAVKNGYRLALTEAASDAG